MRYHISPPTGLPTICRAEVGSCPYEGKGHFDSYEQATEYAYKQLEDEYDYFPSGSDPITEEEEKEVFDEDVVFQLNYGRDLEEAVKQRGYPDLSDEEIEDKLSTIDEQAILVGVLHQRVLVDTDDEVNERRINAVLDNPNLEQRWVEEILSDGYKYNKERIYNILNTKKNLTTKGVVGALESFYGNDKYYFARLVGAKGIREDIIKDIVGEDGTADNYVWGPNLWKNENSTKEIDKVLKPKYEKLIDTEVWDF